LIHNPAKTIAITIAIKSKSKLINFIPGLSPSTNLIILSKIPICFPPVIYNQRWIKMNSLGMNYDENPAGSGPNQSESNRKPEGKQGDSKGR